MLGYGPVWEKIEMKKLILFLMAMMFVACSAPVPSEEIGEVQEAVGTCPRPTGGTGDTSGTVDGYVSRISASSTSPWKFRVQYHPFSGLDSVGFVYFGGVSVANAHAKITGPGWQSVGGSKIVDIMFQEYNTSLAIASGCTSDPNLKCMLVSEDLVTYTPALYFDKSYSDPGSAHAGAPNGLTAIIGMGATLPQKVRFYFDVGSTPSSIGSTTKVFSGPMLDACATP